MTTPTPITFLIPGGMRIASDSALPHVRAVRLRPAARGLSAGDVQRVQAVPGQDVVLLTLGNGQGPDLCLHLHPKHARDLLRAQVPETGEVGRSGATPLDEDTVQVPVQARWQGLGDYHRGGLGDLVFKELGVLGLNPKDAWAKLGAQAMGALLDGQVNEGVYALKPSELSSLKTASPVPIATSAEPTLVLIHGTFVDTQSTFGQWWKGHAGLVAQLFQHYDQRVYALDHCTVLRSPIANALVLAKAVPQDARLHLVTHSRGGQVADVLLRASLGVDEADLAVFQGDAYAQHRQDLLELGQELQKKNVRVERVVRVACPAHGTLLASDRLDAYLSAFAWLLDRVGVPVVPELLRFADAVARERAKPTSMPGLEALRGTSAVVEWINQPDPVAPGVLRVVAGDVEGDSLTSWIKTLLADAFYWTDNDLVVQTRSMYGGMLRAQEASFMLDRGGKTDHFSYFKNDRTANGIAQALMEDHLDEFAPIGPQSLQGKSESGSRGVPVLEDGSRPAVVVLPGFIGSNLRRVHKREWLSMWRLFGVMKRIALSEPGVREDGPLEGHYNDLMDHLRSSHEVVPFGYDWRVSLSDSAARLTEAIQRLLDRRRTTGQPVRLLAHSMGSMVLRVMQLEHPKVWQDMMAVSGSRVLMLGPPHAGSWAPMSIYTGDDSFVQFLSTAGGAFHEQAARETMVSFPGLLQLQAGLTDPTSGLANEQVWREMGDRDYRAAQASRLWHSLPEQVAAFEWAIPRQVDLDQAVALRQRLDAQLPSLLANADQLTVVLGRAPETPCGLGWDDRGMHYLNTAEGDGRVTWASACLPGVATWMTDHAHGALPTIKNNFTAYTELLAAGTTSESGVSLWSTRRGIGSVDVVSALSSRRAMARWRDRRQPDGAAPPTEATLAAAALGSAPYGEPLGHWRVPTPTLTVEVLNGNLSFVAEPLLLGHSRSLSLTGTEAVVNGLMGQALQQALDIGLYPEALGQHQIFVNQEAVPSNPFVLPRPGAAIVVGLGDEGQLTPNALATSVRQAVLAYQRQQAPLAMGAVDLTLATTNLGSGGNLSVGQAVTAVVRGVLEANDRLASGGTLVDWPPVRRLLVVELYHNRALDAWRALRDTIEAGLKSVTLLPQVRTIDGARARPVAGHYRGADHDLLRITEKALTGDGNQPVLEYSVSTPRARAEVMTKALQRSLVQTLVMSAEQDVRYNADLARSLYQLLLPQELKSQLGTASTLKLEVDSHTACYPWEMLDDGGCSPSQVREPWGLRLSGALVRSLCVQDYRRQPVDALSDNILVVGAPKLDVHPPMPDLPGAREEANAVATLFGSRATLLLNSDFLNIVNATLTHSWKVIHMAGHGQYDPQGGHTGLLMSHGVVLGPAELESMPTVPELVFVNCCHLGKTEATRQPQRAVFAANVAEQLIRNGVRCVVAAGWAVDDAAAKAFALGFYGVLDHGGNFAEAVHAARRNAYETNPGSNTWAAYQCYGDPAWTLQRNAVRADTLIRTCKTPVLATPEELMLAVEALRCDAQAANDAKRHQLLAQLNQLKSAVPDEWKRQGKVAEALGLAWRDLGDKAKALAWLDVAVSAEDGSATLGAREQQLNIMARRTDISDQDLAAVIHDISALVSMAPTAERYTLLGSAYKRMVMLVDRRSVTCKRRMATLEHMGEAYAQALTHNPSNRHYPLMQCFNAQLRLHWLDAARPLPSRQDMDAARSSLVQQVASNPDFWNVAGLQELDFLEALMSGHLATRIDVILAGLGDLQQRVRNPHFWASVRENAQFLLSHPPAMASACRQAVSRYLHTLDGFAKG